MWGHDEINCWGQCHHCLGWGHDNKLCPTTNQVVIDKIKAKKAKIKAKAKARKATKNAQKTEANFDLNLPDDFDDSSDDGSVMTVVTQDTCYLQ